MKLIDISDTLLIHLIDTLNIMSTTKKRINISISKSLDEALGKLSKRDQVPQATKAAELLRLAIEIEEDQIWDEIASKRDTKKAKFISHKKAWN